MREGRGADLEVGAPGEPSAASGGPRGETSGKASETRYEEVREMESKMDPVNRLEYLRGELRAERISYGELAELQALAEHIEPGDTELLEAAGIPEHENVEAGQGKLARYVIVLDRMDEDDHVKEGRPPRTELEGREQVAAELQEAMSIVGEPAGFFRVVRRAVVPYTGNIGAVEDEQAVELAREALR